MTDDNAATSYDQASVAEDGPSTTLKLSSGATNTTGPSGWGAGFDGGIPGVRKTDTAILNISLLGAMSAVTLENVNILPTGAKTRGLLAILALSDRRPVPRRRLAELLWSRRPEDQARASLRQEIHRLAEALSPLGADILDVQRHALALKPVLTTVDVERHLNASPTNVLHRPDIGDGCLLSDLVGVDPALDQWLREQEAQLKGHFVSSLEQAMGLQPDPDAALLAARRILRLEPLHEGAWRTSFRALMQRGESGAAVLAAEQCLRSFRDTVQGEPGAVTRELIEALRLSQANVDHSPPSAYPAPEPGPSAAHARAEIESPVQMAGPDALLAHGAIGLGSASAVHGMSSGLSPAVSLLDATTAQIATLAFTPFNVSADGASAFVAQSAAGLLAVGLAQFGFFSVFPPEDRPMQGDYPAGSSARAGAGFVVGGVLQDACGYTPDGRVEHRLIIRVVDQRRGKVIVWAGRYRVTQDNLEEIMMSITTEITWRIMMSEARNLAGRASRELPVMGVGLQVFALVMRGDTTSFGLAEELLEHAERRDPGQPFLLFVSAMYHLLRAGEIQDHALGASLGQAISRARHLSRVMPESLSGKLLLARILLSCPSEQKRGLSVLADAFAAYSQAVTGDVMVSADRDARMADMDGGNTARAALGMGLLVRAFADQVQGKRQEAVRGYECFRRRHPTHPLGEFLGVDFVVSLILAGKADEAVSCARANLGVTPNRVTMLVLLLAALVATGSAQDDETRDEIDEILVRLSILRPEISVAAVAEHYSWMCENDREMLASLVRQAGLDGGSERRGTQMGASWRNTMRPALGGVRRTGYEDDSKTGATVP